jgi:predicted nucleic acid-binding protein
MSTLVDSNVILDVIIPDPKWLDWSASQLSRCADEGDVVINPIVYAETSVRYLNADEFDRILSRQSFVRETLPWPAAFRAGKAQLEYRQGGGVRDRTLPDFFIGAHAELRGHRLLTRDARRYRAYFPDLDIIAPDTHP